MVQIFADLSGMQDDILQIGGEDFNHIKNVLRMRPGEEISVYDRAADPAWKAGQKGGPPRPASTVEAAEAAGHAEAAAPAEDENASAPADRKSVV